MSPIEVTASDSPINVSASGTKIDATVSGGQGPQGPPGPSGAGNWSEIEGKPTEFPPEDHSHAIADVADLSDALDGKLPLAGGAMDPSAIITLSDATTDSEFAGWGFGVQVTEDASQYAYVEAGGFYVHGSGSSTTVTPAGITLHNATQLVKGSFDNNTGGANGISMICAVGYELNWQGGRLRNVQIAGNGTPQPIFCDSTIEFTGEDGSITLTGDGIIFPDGTQTVAWTGSMSYDDLDDLPTLFDGAYASLTGLPTLGTAAAAATTDFAAASHGHALAAISDAGTAASKNTPATGNAGSTEVVLGSDTRLSDARTPAAHNQAWSTITSTPTSLSGYGITDAVGSSDSRLTNQRVPTDGSVTAGKIAAGQAVSFRAIAVSGGSFFTGWGIRLVASPMSVENTGGTVLFYLDGTGTVTTGTWQATAIGVAYGGTGATTASAARTNLGLAIGTDVAAASHTHTASAITDFSSAVAAASPEEVVEYTTAASFPASGNASLLYLATDSARAYRWVGSQYAEIGPTSISVTASVTSVAGRTGAITIAAADVSGLGSLATQSSVAYSSLTGTPSTFAPAAHNQAWSTITATPTTLAGYSISDAVSSSDARLSNARTPTAHKTSHATGGSDALTASDIGAAASSHTHSASDITTGTVATARLGSGTADSTTVLRGDGAWAAPADSLLRALFVPPAPTSLTATAGNAQVALSWSAPSVVAQAPITDYVVQFSSNSGSTWTTFADGTSTATSATVTGLTNGTAYVFRVAAVNAVGTGSYTGQSSSVTPIAGNVVTAITGLQAWYDASDASTLFDATSGGSLVAADGGVARWEDKSGNARHFTQSTSGNRPLRKTGIQNSLAVLRFDGSNDFMSVPSSTAIFKFLHDGDSTVFVVLKPGVVANPDALYWILGNSTDSGSTDEQTGYYLRYDDRTSARADLDDSLVHVVLNGGSPRFVGVAKSALPSNTFSLATVRGDPGNATIASRSQVRRNGGSAITQVTSDTNGATALPTGNATQNMFVGATPGATLSWPLNGDIAEILMYDSALSDTDRSAVESYLRAKWGIS